VFVKYSFGQKIQGNIFKYIFSCEIGVIRELYCSAATAMLLNGCE
jgi:hypothetical protein